MSHKHQYHKPSSVSLKQKSPTTTEMLSSLFSGNSLFRRFFAQDGYANPAAYLGESSPLSAAGTFRRFHLTARTELLTTTYREDWLAKRIIGRLLGIIKDMPYW